MGPGTLIAGKYRLKHRIGKGSMGVVWAALNEELERVVALKLIESPNDDLRARLLREAKACGRLRHPNVVHVYDVGRTEHGDPFLVMELLSGETLADRLRARGPLDAPTAIRIARDIARALRVAHQAGVIHRDLKPANVFLHRAPDLDGHHDDEVEQVKVVDFGVSKIGLGDATSTQTGALVGSPAYMSPEQAAGEKHSDPRSDLWSLGVVLFEMIAGTRPFPKPTMAVLADILTHPIPRLSTVVAGLDPRIDEVVARCMTREIDRRMPNAQDLLDALRALADAENNVPGPQWHRVSLPDPAELPPTTQDDYPPRPDDVPTVSSSSGVVEQTALLPQTPEGDPSTRENLVTSVIPCGPRGAPSPASRARALPGVVVSPRGAPPPPATRSDPPAVTTMPLDPSMLRPKKGTSTDVPAVRTSRGLGMSAEERAADSPSEDPVTLPGRDPVQKRPAVTDAATCAPTASVTVALDPVTSGSARVDSDDRSGEVSAAQHEEPTLAAPPRSANNPAAAVSSISPLSRHSREDGGVESTPRRRGVTLAAFAILGLIGLVGLALLAARAVHVHPAESTTASSSMANPADPQLPPLDSSESLRAPPTTARVEIPDPSPPARPKAPTPTNPRRLGSPPTPALAQPAEKKRDPAHEY